MHCFTALLQSFLCNEVYRVFLAKTLLALVFTAKNTIYHLFLLCDRVSPCDGWLNQVPCMHVEVK